MVALYAYERELDRALRVTSNPLLAEIRLTWWREVLEEIFAGERVRSHPVAVALASCVRASGHPREPLEAMIEARIAPPTDPLEWADRTAGPVTLLAARTLDRNVPAPAVLAAGRVWGLSGLARAGKQVLDLTGPMAEAARLAPSVGAEAFPAIAHVTLARAANPSPLETRVRLLWAVLRGRL